MNISSIRNHLKNSGFKVSKRGDYYLITDSRGIPVHQTHIGERQPYTQTIEDVVEWIEELCD